MSSPVPQPPSVGSGSFQRESNIFSSINDMYRFFQPKIWRVSKNSPPVLNVDVKEGEIVWDRTLVRLYTVSDGSLKYVQFS